MTWTDDLPSCEHALQVAPYLLGALESPESERYQEHLRGCAVCRQGIEYLRPAVATLPAATPQRPASDALRDRIMVQVRAEAELFRAAGPAADGPPARRRQRLPRRALVAATGAIASAAALGGLLIATDTPKPTQLVVPAVVASSAPGAHAELRRIGGRAELIVTGMPQPALGWVYEVWLAHHAQAPQATDALFSVDRSGNGSIDVPGRLRGIEHLTVTVEPLGGSRHPTGPPIIMATL